MNEEHEDAIELVHVRGAYEIELAGERQLSAYAPPPFHDIDDPCERLVCTAWNGPSEGQALRRAARLADRVLVIVTSDWLPASILAQFKRRLGRSDAVGYLLVGVSDAVAALPDRAGCLEEFWQGSAPS
jgi:hypothetical protein